MCIRSDTRRACTVRVNCPQAGSEGVAGLRSLPGIGEHNGRTTVRRRSLRMVAGLAVATALLGGCAAKHEASETLPSASETSASPSLQPLGPADFPVPDEARTQDAAGAQAFVQYYIELTNYLLPTLDSAPLRDLSKDCQTCNNLADGYDQSRAAGHRFEGGRITIASAGAPTITGSTAEIAFVLEQDTVTVYDAAGNVIPEESSGAYSLTGGASLGWDGARTTWVVTQLTTEPQ